MAAAKSSGERLRDPLSEVTRKERTYLLAVSTVGIVIAQSGLVPSKISALGIEFDHADQTVLLRILAAIVIYFIVAFVVYGLTDLHAWSRSRMESREEYEATDKEFHRLLDSSSALAPSIESRFDDVGKLAGHRFMLTQLSSLSNMRAVFEFFVPVAIALYAVLVLLLTAPPPQPAQSPPKPAISAPMPLPKGADQTK